MSLVSRFGISIETGLSVWDVEETKEKKGIYLLCFALRADSVANSFCLSSEEKASPSALTHALPLAPPSVARLLRFYTRSASEGY